MARMPRMLQDARDRLVEENIGLVVHIAHRVAGRLPSDIERDELVAAGMLGLVEAATRFDAERGMPFAAFAGLRIEGAILDLLRSTDRLPRAVRRVQRRIEASETRLLARLGRQPSADEVAEDAGMSVDELHRVRAWIASGNVESLDLRDRDDTLRYEAAVPEGESVEDLVIDSESHRAVRLALGSLSERHRMVIIGCMFEGRQLRELADLLGVTRSRVSQLKEEAIRQLRLVLAEQELIDLTAEELEQESRRRRGRGRAVIRV